MLGGILLPFQDDVSRWVNAWPFAPRPGHGRVIPSLFEILEVSVAYRTYPRPGRGHGTVPAGLSVYGRSDSIDTSSYRYFGSDTSGIGIGPGISDIILVWLLVSKKYKVNSSSFWVLVSKAGE